MSHIGVKLPKKIIKALSEMMDEGLFLSRGEAIRFSLINMLIELEKIRTARGYCRSHTSRKVSIKIPAALYDGALELVLQGVHSNISQVIKTALLRYLSDILWREKNDLR